MIIKADDHDADALCFGKAKAAGEDTFTLRSQDSTAPKVVALWIAENIETAPEAKLHHALDIAISMRRCGYRKMPD